MGDSYILGITDGHNSSASLIADNKIIGAISEERFLRIKNYRGFPKYSINYILKEHLKDNSVDFITVGGLFRKSSRLKEILSIGNQLDKPILYFNHHQCHSSHYLMSNFKECLIITMDGAGDSLSSTISIGNSKKGVELIGQSSFLDSVGDFYASITESLGFKPMEDEGKVMCLSSYHNNKDIDIDLNNVIDYLPSQRTFKNYLGVVGFESTKLLKKLFKLKNLNPKKFEDKIKISKWAQDTLEKVVLKMVDSFSREYGIKNIVLSGGVFQNVKLNMVIRDRGYDIFVSPFSGDEGLSVGSSLLLNNKPIILKDTYLGYAINNETIEKMFGMDKDKSNKNNNCNNLDKINKNNINNNIIDNNKNNIDKLINKFKKKYSIKYIEDKDIYEVIGDIILNGNIVSMCRGRMEFGPRALGNRSIVALPTEKNKDKLNKLLKRDFFMPFAPTIIYDYADEYMVNSKYSPFMTELFKVYDDKVKDIRGVIHIDNTTRPQTLIRETNNIYYNTINHIYENNNIPLLLNTSFNKHGEPIVCTEYDAIKSFVGDYLLLGNYLIKRRT